MDKSENSKKREEEKQDNRNWYLPHTFFFLTFICAVASLVAIMADAYTLALIMGLLAVVFFNVIITDF